ncbi:MAG: hypothetical protein R2697_06995 [Ilumatobacteraceae bacterium]
MAIDRRAARLGVLAFVGLGLFSLLGVRLWFLQTVKADELQETITVSRTRTVQIAPERGRIVDVNGRILADNDRILSVGIDWDVLRRKSQREDIFTRLSGWIDVPVETMEENFDPSGRTVNPFLPYIVREDIDEPTAIAILERAEDFPGVSIETSWKRTYPYGQHAAHVVGYMGAITAEQVDDFRTAGYLLDERVGQFGVERSMEQVLHGSWGYRVIEVDAANRPVRVIEEVPPINGFDVQLTIDLEAQQYLEQTLETTLKARQGQTAENPIVKKPDGTREKMDLTLPDRVPYKAPAASGLIMDYTTGEVLAMASYPGFDNRWFEAGISGDKFQEVFPVTDDPDKSILVNRCPGAVQPRLDVQAVHGVRGAQHRPDVGGRLLRRPRHVHPQRRVGQLRQVRVGAREVRVQERDVRQRSAVPVRRRERRERAGGLVRHVLLPHRREHHAPQRLPAGVAERGAPLRVRRRHRHRIAVRVRRHRARPRTQADLRRTRSHLGVRGAELLRRRQRAAGDRSGSAVGDAAPARHRLCDDRQRRVRLPADHHQGDLEPRAPRQRDGRRGRLHAAACSRTAATPS